MAASKKSLPNTDQAIARPEAESLANLFSRLGDDVMQLFNSQLALFKVEIKEEVRVYTRGAALIAAGAAIAMVGFAFLNVAVAFGVSILFARANFSLPASYALGFVATGAFYVLVGGILVLVMKNRLANQELVPPITAEELRKDKQWLKTEL